MAAPLFLILWPIEPQDAPPTLHELQAGQNPQEKFRRAMASRRFRLVALAQQFQEGDPQGCPKTNI